MLLFLFLFSSSKIQEEISVGDVFLYQYSDTQKYPIELELPPGKYYFELWGAQSWASGWAGGLGGYVAGTISIRQKRRFYINVGSKSGFNGGGTCKFTYCYGGGATDIRLTNTSDFDGLVSRIAVAGGGGGFYMLTAMTTWGGPGNAGGLSGSSVGIAFNPGYQAYDIASTSGNQSSGGISGVGIAPTSMLVGSFGQGGYGKYCGGGSGYFGGAGGNDRNLLISFGGGGSSYISGYNGCLAVDYSQSNSTNIVMKDDSYHYSGLYFTNITFLSGSDPGVPLIDGGTETGHSGDGIVRITVHEIYPPKTTSFKHHIYNKAFLS